MAVYGSIVCWYKRRVPSLLPGQAQGHFTAAARCNPRRICQWPAGRLPWPGAQHTALCYGLQSRQQPQLSCPRMTGCMGSLLLLLLLQVVTNHIAQLRPYLSCSKASSIRGALMAATGSVLLQVLQGWQQYALCNAGRVLAGGKQLAAAWHDVRSTHWQAGSQQWLILSCCAVHCPVSAGVPQHSPEQQSGCRRSSGPPAQQGDAAGTAACPCT